MPPTHYVHKAAPYATESLSRIYTLTPGWPGLEHAGDSKSTTLYVTLILLALVTLSSGCSFMKSVCGKVHAETCVQNSNMAAVKVCRVCVACQ